MTTGQVKCKEQYVAATDWLFKSCPFTNEALLPKIQEKNIQPSNLQSTKPKYQKSNC